MINLKDTIVDELTMIKDMIINELSMTSDLTPELCKINNLRVKKYEAFLGIDVFIR